MPPKSHNKKHNAQRRPVEKPVAAQTGATGPVDSTNAATATLASAPAVTVRPSAKQSPATQPAPRKIYVGQELLRVAIVSVITLAILVVLAFVLR